MIKKSFILAIFMMASFFSGNIYSKENDKVEVVSTSSTGKHSIGIGLGQTFLMRKFDDNGDNKVTADFFYNYAASYSFDFVLNAHYSKHSKQADNIQLMGLTASIKSKFFDFDNFAPYILGGLGFYRPKAHRVYGGVGQDTEAKYTFGFNLGAGVDLRLNEKYSLGILGHYHNPFEVEQDNQSDLDGQYFKLMLLLMYTL